MCSTPSAGASARRPAVLRKMGADYLLYALLDVIVDNYFLHRGGPGRAGSRNMERKISIRAPSDEDLLTIQEMPQAC
jgi:hypothetical protein